MSQELFADRIGDITVANGMVRINFFHSRHRTQRHRNRVHGVAPLGGTTDLI